MKNDEPYFKGDTIYADDGICDNITRMKIITNQSSEEEEESDSDKPWIVKWLRNLL